MLSSSNRARSNSAAPKTFPLVTANTLSAAAPDLLSVARKITELPSLSHHDIVDGVPSQFYVQFEVLRAQASLAIAKAEGGGR